MIVEKSFSLSFLSFICSGFVAIAYVDGAGIDSNENMPHTGNRVHDKTLIPDKESVIHDADVTVNEAIFDVLSRKGDGHLSDDSDENFLSASENGVGLKNRDDLYPLDILR